MSMAVCICNFEVVKHLKLMLVFIRPAQGLGNCL